MSGFASFNLSRPLFQAIEAMGFQEPTPIQAQAISILMEAPTDFLGMAATGTGKTAAFGIPLVEQIHPGNPYIQGVVLCPTRELAMQVSAQLEQLGSRKGVRVATIYGGSNFAHQIAQLRSGVQIVVATPGRLLDHLQQRTLNLQKVKTIVLDEADEMISMGFQEDLEAILSHTSAQKRKIWLFAATMEPRLRKVTEKYLKDPRHAEINRSEMLPGTVKQFYFPVRDEHRHKLLCRLLDSEPDLYGIIFCETKIMVQELTEFLRSRKYPVDSLHGDMDQKARERSMNLLHQRKVKMLVCTDVAARGLDVKDLTHVINYGLPLDSESYVHRIGRTGRSGKGGVSFSLVGPSQLHQIGRLEAMTKSKMEVGQLPPRSEIAKRRIDAYLSEVQGPVHHEEVEALMGEEWKKFVAGLSKVEIAARFLALRFHTLLDPEENLVFIPEDPKRKAREERESRRGRFKPNRPFKGKRAGRRFKTPHHRSPDVHA